MFRRLVATRRAPQSTVLSMLRLFGKIEPKNYQIRAWLSRRHRWAPGVRNPIKSLVMGLSLLVNNRFFGNHFYDFFHFWQLSLRKSGKISRKFPIRSVIIIVCFIKKQLEYLDRQKPPDVTPSHFLENKCKLTLVTVITIILNPLTLSKFISQYLKNSSCISASRLRLI